MPELIIDGRKIAVPSGTKVIKAAEMLGIMVPRFCYHEGLGSVGACRLCAVKFLEGPVKGLEMSCMVDAKDGMVVSTDHRDAVAHRKQIIEWLMMNHPHDCPVCDEGGHCLLQDETLSGGHVLRRYLGPKRTFRDQYLGVFVQHEMNRCIHCWRCRRFYQEYSGYRDLGAMQIGWRTYFGRFEEGPLESPFAGNLIDVCPTGVYTDKPARYKGRRWDFERGPSLCLHCSLGCNTTGSVRYREIMRQEARLNKEVNGYFMCDRGRFGFPFHQHPDRPRRPKIGGGEVSWEGSFQTFRTLFQQVGAESVLCLSSPRASLETQVALRRFCQALALPSPRFFISPEREAKARAAVAGLDERLAVSMAEIEQADFVLVLGADPVNEAPMSALAIRQAWRNGATVVVADPRPIELPLEYDLLSVRPEYLPFILNSMVQHAFEKGEKCELSDKAQTFLHSLTTISETEQPWNDRLNKAAERLRESKRPVIVCGTDVGGENLPDLAADHALLLREAGKKAGLFYLLPGPNGFGAGLLTASGRRPNGVVEAMERGDIKGLLLVESDPFFDCPDLDRLERAMDRLEFVADMDYLPSRSFKKAHVAWPTLTLFEERNSTFINQEGRLQSVPPICQGGLPISQISGGGHPPRTFVDHIPGAGPRSAAEILSELAGVLSGDEHDFSPQTMPGWLEEQKLAPRGLNGWGHAPASFRIIPERRSGKDYLSGDDSGSTPKKDVGGPFRLLLVDRVFGTEELSSYSDFIQAAEKEPVLFVSAKDAENLHLATGDIVSLDFPRQPLTIKVRVRADMACGVLVVPRYRQLRWQQMEGRCVTLSKDRIHKV